MGVIDLGARGNFAVGLCGVRKMILRQSMGKPQRHRIAGGFKEPDYGLNHPAVGITRCRIVNDLLAALPAGIELLQLPTAVIA